MGGYSQGPFSQELVPQAQRTPQLNPNTPPTKTGGAFFLASKFLEGAAQSRAKSFAQSEAKKQQYVDTLARKVQEVQANPNLTDQAKQQFMQGANDVLAPHVQETLKKSDTKKNPVLGAAKSLWDGLTGGKYESTKADPKSVTDFLAGPAHAILNDPNNLKATHEAQYSGVFDQVAKELGPNANRNQFETDPRVITASIQAKKVLGDQHANGIRDTYLAGRFNAPQPGSAEDIEVQNRLKYGAPPPDTRQQVQPGGQPPPLATLPNGRPTLQQQPDSAAPPAPLAQLPNGRPTLQRQDTGEPPAPRGAQGQPPQATDAQFFADMSRSTRGYVSKTATAGMSGGKPAEGVLVRSPYPDRNGYYNPTTGQRMTDFAPRPTATEEKPPAPPVTKIFYDDKHPKGVERAWMVEDGKGKWVDTGGTGKPNKPSKAGGGGPSFSQQEALNNKFEEIESQKDQAMHSASATYDNTQQANKKWAFETSNLDNTIKLGKDGKTPDPNGKTKAEAAYERVDADALRILRKNQDQAQKDYESKISVKKNQSAVTGEPPAPRGASGAPPAAKFPGAKAPKPNSPVTEDVMDQYYDLYNGDKEQMRKALIANGFHLGGK